MGCLYIKILRIAPTFVLYYPKDILRDLGYTVSGIMHGLSHLA